MNEDEVIRDVQRKIDREKALINAANAMRQSTNNPAVLSRLDSQTKDGRRNIEYLEGRLKEIEHKKMGHSMGGMSLSSESAGPMTQPNDGLGQHGRKNPLATPPKDSLTNQYGARRTSGNYDHKGASQSIIPPKAPYAPPPPPSKQKSNYSKLGKFILLLQILW